MLIIGCGDLGGMVAHQLAQLDFEVIGVKRNNLEIAGVTMMQADVTQPYSLVNLTTLQPTILIYCVAANGQTDEQYKAQYVDGLKNVLTTQLENSALKLIFFVSSTRVYGQNSLQPSNQATNQESPALLNEAIEAIPIDFGGERLLEAENLLNNFTLKHPTCSTTVLRLSGIYGPGRLRMINLAKSPQNWPNQNSWSNRIHRDDAAAFIVFLIQQLKLGDAPKRLYIVTDSRPASQHEVLSWIAAQLDVVTESKGISNIPPIEGGKRLSNQAMLATGFKLKYPDFKAGYQSLLSNA